MRKVASIFLCMALILVFTNCERDHTAFPTKGDETIEARSLTAEEQLLIESDTNFGLTLFRELSATQTESNIFISPLSVAMALGMTLNGASGETYTAMKNTLELQGLTEEQINQSFQSLIELLTNLDQDVIFEIANSIWIRLGYPVLNEFKETNQTYFDAEIRELDFSLPEAVDIINGWISDKTHGKIENALDRIDPLAMLYLINAIYFKGTWTYQFEEADTYDAQFSKEDGTLVSCKMMRIEQDLAYWRGDDVQILDLPYGNGKFSMTIILPDYGKTVDEIIATMTPDKWTQWLGNLYTTALTIGLPRFKLEYDILLNDILEALGMGVAFSDFADFSRINPDGDLYISRVIHKTFVDVNEEGTEAAAVTIVEICETSIGKMMIMDRPFIFAIRENHSNTILFIGKLVEPPAE